MDELKLDPELEQAAEEVRKRRTLARFQSAEDFAAKRAQGARLAAWMNETLDRSGVRTETLSIPGPQGTSLRMRLHRPSEPGTAMPCLYTVHGGGMVSGSTLIDDPVLVPLVRELQCVGASIEYRLAPEHRAPAAAEDCYAGLAWLHAQARTLGIDPGRIAIRGMSGGGGVAASAVLMARDRGGPELCLQQLIYPQLDDRNTSVSSQGDWLAWTREMNLDAWHAVLGERRGSDDVTGYEAAARATDLSGLPPTYIDVGAMEIFRDESIAYATRLVRAGIPTEIHVYPGCFHGFELYAPKARVSQLALAARRSSLERAWFAAPRAA